LRTQQFLSLV